MVEIKTALKEQAAEIARLIMMAMTDDCCLYFCGDGYGLADFHAFTQTMEVIQYMACLLVSQLNDRVLVQRDTATDTVVVRRQQVLQKLIIGSKPLHLQVGMCRHRSLNTKLPSPAVHSKCMQVWLSSWAFMT